MSHHCADLAAIAPLETHTVKSIGDHCKGTCAPGQTGDRPGHSYARGLDSATVVLSEDAPARFYQTDWQHRHATLFAFSIMDD